MLASSSVLVVIGFVLLARHVRHGKVSALLLANFNFVLAASSLHEGINNFYRFTTPFNNVTEGLVFVLLTWAMTFLLLFLQDIFTGSFAFKDHRISHLVFVILVVTGVFPLLIHGMGVRINALTVAGYVSLGIMFLFLTSWQAFAAFKLVGKVEERRARTGLVMIGMSGLVLIIMAILIVVKSAFSVLDLLVPMVAFCASIVAYLGYVYPSKGK